MTLGIRKLVVVGLIAAVLLLANVMAIAAWLDGEGVVGWARNLRTEYLTGTALAVIAVLLLLLGPSVRMVVTQIRRCPVCDHVLLRRGRYCAECGGRV